MSPLIGYSSRHIRSKKGCNGVAILCHRLKRRSRSFYSTKTLTTSIQEVAIDSPNEDLTPILEPFFNEKQPVVLRGAVAHLPAMQLWKSWDHLDQNVDRHTSCAVEIGGSYTSCHTSNISFGDFIAYLRFFEERHGRSGTTNPPASDLVYMAQNEILDGLRPDFAVPSFTQTLGHGHLYSVMMWVGPYGCVSPLHFDPLDNALMQFVGVKRAILYPPQTQLYAGFGTHQKNTSPHNPEEPVDLVNFPLLVDLPPAIECQLNPGDILYVPQKWWHHVRTVETSISINAWWR